MKDLHQKYVKYCESNEIDLAKDFERDVSHGLTQIPKSLPCKYIYNETGSRLFQEICQLPGYYLTNTEIEILRSHESFFQSFTSEEQMNLIELGSGDGVKSSIILHHLLQNNIGIQYIPIDISSSVIEEITNRFEQEFESIKVMGIVADYFHGLEYVSKQVEGTNMVLFLGSNIGNMNPSQTQEFLGKIHDVLKKGDYLLIGFDLKKDVSTLLAAYDDRKGVTREFHKNLLHRINEELKGDFNPDDFDYYCFYDPFDGAIKSYLYSKKEQKVNISAINETIMFNQWEIIHTESSYKYSREDIDHLATSNGFEVIEHLTDQENFFIDSVWKVRK